MIEVHAERTFAVPADQLWPLIDDPAEMGRWFGFAERMELLQGTGVGRRQRLYGRWGSKRSEVDQRIVAYEPGRLLAWVHEAERLDGKPAPRFARETRFLVRLEPVAGGTLIRLDSCQVPASALKGLVIRLFGRREVARQMQRSLQYLADLLA